MTISWLISFFSTDYMCTDLNMWPITSMVFIIKCFLKMICPGPYVQQLLYTGCWRQQDFFYRHAQWPQSVLDTLTDILLFFSYTPEKNLYKVRWAGKY